MAYSYFEDPAINEALANQPDWVKWAYEQEWSPSGEWNGKFIHLDDDGIQNQYDMSRINVDNVSELSKAIANRGSKGISPEQQQIINNLVAQYDAKVANDSQKELRDTSLISTYQQAQTLGLNPSGAAMSLGGANSGASSSMARSDMSNNAQETKINEFNQKAQMARTLVSLIGSLGSAGVYGGSIAAGRIAASKLAKGAARIGGSLASAKSNVDPALYQIAKYDWLND